MSGLYLSYDWSGGTLQFNDGTNPAETFTYDTDMGYPSATFHQLVTTLEAWLNDAGRAWTGVITTVASWTNDSNGYHASATLRFTGGTFTTTGAGRLAEAHTGLPDVSSAAVVTGDATPSAVQADWRLSGWHSTPAAGGAHGDLGSWAMNGGAGYADMYQPRVTTVMDESQAAQWVSALRVCKSPRLASVYDERNDTFRLLSLGRVRQSPVGTSHQRVSLEVMA